MCSVRLEPPTHTIVEYFHNPESTGRSCGYCKSETGSFSDGMWAHTMSPENYESLINNGWRRSGCYLYKPRGPVTCCPVYTIRNISSKVEITRSQRKVLKRFKKYLADGVLPKQQKYSTLEQDHAPDKMSMECAHEISGTPEINVDKPQKPAEKQPSSVRSTHTNSPQTSKKEHPLKKKLLRRERKRQKLIAKGLDPVEFFKRNERNRVSELQDFFTPKDSDKVLFSTKLVQVDSPEFDEMFPIEHLLYKKYQMHTHGDKEHDCRASQFRRFLCDNPFGAPSSEGRVPHGTFHNQYYMNGVLIAVGVIDILPSCVSSVYFFYDPEYSFLSPGTLGALHEISFVNNLTTQDPTLQHYYLGYYIHKCDKMKYKRKFRPCELLCPVSNAFLRFDERVLSLLDSMNGGCAQLDQHMSIKTNTQDVRNVLLLHNRRVLPFDRYPKKTRKPMS
ncbi:Arginyl-tRNA--protein transferase 1 [Orchesella cincta]|uniref:Arginyl-tRNA--protein transferase 1 n=1 Tax=Orchesella cincta TaxID=48709 RepID=A0A1D2M2P4_ORCCI|nr:Arginyl-tRNA--protein transferase 1 [Orchesella cincta]